MAERSDPDLEARLTHYQSFCGCKSSAWMLSIALMGYPVFLVLAPAGVSPVGWSRLWWGASVVFLAGLVGKLAGLAVGAFMYGRTVRAVSKSRPVSSLPNDGG